MSKIEKSYWDNVDKGYHFVDTREYEFLTSLLINAESIFEASVGTGKIIDMLRRKGWKGKYLGSDYVNNFIEAAKEHNPKEEFIKVDLREPISLPDNSFDYSIIHHGLEYVYPYELALKELARITKKYVFISMWIELSNSNKIRFNEEGKWNVNYYDKDEFDKITSQIFKAEVMYAKVTTEDLKINYWYIFEV